jgi:peptide/nickel transport system substrate-binding protein
MSGLQDLQEQILSRQIGRRDVLRRALALGLSAPVIAGLLAACGDDDDDDDTDTDGEGEATEAESGGAATEAEEEPTEAEGGEEEEPTEAEGGEEEPTEAEDGGEGEATEEEDGGEGSESGGMGRGLGDLVRILYWQAPTILNPHFAQGDKDSSASSLILEPLIHFDAAGEIQLALAAEIPSVENGGLAEDGMSVTWKLRDDVVWSDGTPFTAEDVRFTWEYVTNPDSSATTFATYDVITDVEVVDDHTVTLHFDAPNPAWFVPFATGYGGQPLPAHILGDAIGAAARDHAFNLAPIGTGPYKLVEFKPGDVATYEINESYRFTDKPWFSNVELKGGGDATSAARAAMQTGDVDYAWNLQVEADILTQMEETAETGKLNIVLGNSVERILMNMSDPNTEVDGERSKLGTEHPFLTDLNVRHALAMACDRDTIAGQLYGAAGSPTANTLVSPERFVSTNTSYVFDTEAAAAMLEEAGWTWDGSGVRSKDGVEMRMLYQTSTNPVRQKTQEIIKQALENMGLVVEIKAIDAGVYFSSDAGNPDTWAHFYADWEMFTNSPSTPYPISYMANYKSDEPEIDIAQKANDWSGPNAYRWINEEYNELYRQAETELDEEAQPELFIRMNDLIVKDDPCEIPLVHRALVSAINNRLKGVATTPWSPETYNVQDWYFEEE